MDTTGHARRRRVKAHTEELKAQVLAQCEEPGASVARVARDHGLNANLVHTWRREQRGPAQAAPAVRAGAGEFVALALPQPASPACPGDIRVELRRAGTTITVTWPAAAASDCAAWLAQWLR